ncbi:MAG: hypothetical protein J5J06_03215 [Phycisphaerae bacterium]|nr:hypothetical protein [Phycisphaerae bacterium]
MAKLKNLPICQEDMLEYLNTSSDFAFELQCLERISGLGFECQHGGSYTDPVTGKRRQFDIRAQKSKGPFRVRCAVECKHVTTNFPLLIMCVPRAPEESFHELLHSYDPDQVPQDRPYIPAIAGYCKTIRVSDHPASEYQIGEPVGKNCPQIGKSKEGEIIASDADVFEKWSQALASAQDLADEAASEGKECNGTFLSLILPILVVPDGRLWKIDYAANGTRNGDPKQVDRCSVFVGHDCFAGNELQGAPLTISHLEFVTLTGCSDMLTGIAETPNPWFPQAHVDRLAEME